MMGTISKLRLGKALPVAIRPRMKFDFYTDFYHDSDLNWWNIDLSPTVGTAIDIFNHSLRIYDDGNKYAHIALPNDRINAIITCRVNISDALAGGSWAPGIFFYWGAGDWASIRARGDNRKFLAQELVGGVSGDTQTGVVITFGVWYWMRIVLTATNIYYYWSTDGVNWTLIRSVARPAGFAGVPPLIILGKGYGDGGAFPNPDLDNDAAAIGFSTSYMDDFYITKI